MITEQSNTKTFTLTIEVDVETLIASYTGEDDSIQLYDIPSIEEMIEFEMGWTSSSGIQVKEIEEIKEYNFEDS